MTRPTCWRASGSPSTPWPRNSTLGLPDSPRVLNALRLCKGTELAALGGDWPAMGVRRVGGAWTLDARQFDLWAQGQISVFRRRAEAAQPTVQMQSRMSLL